MKNNRNTKQDVAIGKIQTDIVWIKKRLNHLGTRQDWIVGSIILGTLLTILVILLTK